MSLDFYIESAPILATCRCSCGVSHEYASPQRHFDANYTHNITPMAEAAGIYEVLWYPERLWKEPTPAKYLIPTLEVGLEKLKSDPDKFKKLNPPNGWGSYDTFVPWVEGVLAACRKNKEAFVRVST